MPATAILAQVTGEAYYTMTSWRNIGELRMIQAKLDRSGRARVIKFSSRPSMQEVTELPEPGTARLYAGPFSGGYEYRFLRGSSGWALKVTNNAQQLVQLDSPFPPFVIAGIPTIHLALSSEDITRSFARGLMDDSDWSDEEQKSTEASFAIAGEDYDKLLAMGWLPERLEDYEYCFVPLSVGCDIAVEHPASGKRLHLTADVGW